MRRIAIKIKRLRTRPVTDEVRAGVQGLWQILILLLVHLKEFIVMVIASDIANAARLEIQKPRAKIQVRRCCVWTVYRLESADYPRVQQVWTVYRLVTAARKPR
jgi:hypothetical protein